MVFGAAGEDKFATMQNEVRLGSSSGVDRFGSRAATTTPHPPPPPTINQLQLISPDLRTSMPPTPQRCNEKQQSTAQLHSNYTNTGVAQTAPASTLQFINPDLRKGGWPANP